MYLPIYLYLFISIFLSTYLSIIFVFSFFLAFYLPIYLSIYPSIYPSIYLSIYLHTLDVLCCRRQPRPTLSSTSANLLVRMHETLKQKPKNIQVWLSHLFPLCLHMLLRKFCDGSCADPPETASFMLVICLSIPLPTYTYIRTYVHTYTYTYMHACIHTYIHACMHT